MKYQTLLNILDKICESAPPGFSIYENIKSEEQLSQARSQAFIHLFLMAKCGVTNFNDRLDLITDGSQDGGLDAYYIDRENKKLLLIQSKFGATKNNFENKRIESDDLVKMELDSILKGKCKDCRNIDFNDKIKSFQKKWSEISDQALYSYVAIILGNNQKYADEQMRKLIGSVDYEVYNFEKSYKELVFPLCSGSYYDPKEIKITINLENKEQSTLKQDIQTSIGKFPVRVLFVPTKEIGIIMQKYKNSILKFNPRNYLTLTRNKVNLNIKDSIINNESNDFAIYNNGITFIADQFKITEQTGTENKGQVIMINPQIINGGQTAFVLSEVYKQHKESKSDIFDGKEVMIKVIVLGENLDANNIFIEKISNATNQQTRVDEADRRSNDSIQIILQENIYNTFGYFYERKKGEFYNGLNEKYINASFIINRYEFISAYLALKGEAANARRSGKELFFKEKNFKEIIGNTNDFKKMVFAYRVLSKLNDKGNTVILKLFGYNFKYCKMAIIAAVGMLPMSEEITKDNVDQLAETGVANVAKEWKSFEKFIINEPNNLPYFSEQHGDFDNYYKGSTINSDIKSFFGKKI